MKSRFVRRNLRAIVATVALLALLATSQFPGEVNAEVPTENKTRQVFEINSFPQITIPTIDELADTQLRDEEVYLENSASQKAEVLKAYLETKNSPLAEKSAYLLTQRDWELIIAISQAESQMCKRQLGNNCWGIGGGNHRKYPNLEFAISDAQLVIGKYVDRGADTPEKILPRYVGWNNRNWVLAVNQILRQLNQLPLEI
jgi:hypothetical protein